MILTEEHVIRLGNKKNKELYKKIDSYCYASKNLYNSTNYLITQCSRISHKLQIGEILGSYEKRMIYEVNCAIRDYNRSRPGKKPLSYIDENNGYIADAYFLSWYLKTTENYKAMPSATCSQICIQVLCKAWKAYYQSIKAYRKNPGSMLGYPNKPGYFDKDTGRNWIVLTSQRIRMDEKGVMHLPEFLSGIHIKPRHEGIRQVRIKAQDRKIILQLMYEEKEKAASKSSGVMGIDIGIDNLMTLCMNTEAHPVIINGRPLKAINQYYNKIKSEMQSISKVSNGRYSTREMEKLTDRRNRKIKDYMHKASRKVIQLALENEIGTIIIGNNQGWKQESDMGKKTNQSFIAIPHRTMIEMIRYKGELAGIKVIITEESYTSGTSYLDREDPIKENYDRSRRIHRGVFQSNKGQKINADVNAAYQIMKKSGMIELKIKSREHVTRINVA